MELIVKPVLIYEIYQRKEATSWRLWGGLANRKEVEAETQRIERELKELTSGAPFPLKIMPLSLVKTVKEAVRLKDIALADVVLIYPASGGGEWSGEVYRGSTLESLVAFNKSTIFFLRHRSGPIYLGYEIIHPRFLRKSTKDQVCQPKITVDDVVVDDYKEILWRLRALYSLKNTLGERIISIGEPSGWGIGKKAVFLARERWKFDLKTVSYSELGRRIKLAKSNEGYLKQAKQEAEKYLSQAKVTLATDRKFVLNAFLLYLVFKDLLAKFGARVITVNECMSTIMPLAKTTACLPLSLLNDEGFLAFCESDFVAIPAGILLHHISSKPVFLNDPTYPHQGIVTLAHCTAPRRMDGEALEPVKLMTHFESDYGAAPKVEMRKGQEITLIDPDFEGKVWIGFKGKILDNPSFPICRSQVEVEIRGNWKELLKEMRGFHWLLAYGDWLKEIGYALKKEGIELRTIR